MRLIAGANYGAGLSYLLADRCELGLDMLCYYDLTSHHNGYDNLRDPRYLNTIALSVKFLYNL